MHLGLKGKVAMVAGASRGLGFALAKALAIEGVQVSMASRNPSSIATAAQLIEQETGSQVLGMATDVQSREAVEQWHRATVQRLGSVDLLVTNSGGPPAGPLGSFDDAAWHSAFELLVLSVIRLVRIVVPSMLASRRGSILMLTSSSVREPIANLALSNVLRASVAGLAKTLANEVAGHGIRVNQLIPGRIATDRLRELDEINSKRLGISISDQQSRAIANIPIGRYGLPDEFARAAVFLLSDAASYITGATLQVDGGLIRSAW